MSTPIFFDPELRRLTDSAVLACMDRFGSAGDLDEHISTNDLVTYLTGQGYTEDIATAAANLWRGW